MARTEPPLPVKYFIAVLYREEEQALEAKNRLVSRWGAIDFEGSDHPFDVTDYYETEMGRNLKRRLFSFERLYAPTFIVEMKLECNDVEAALADEGNRTVNLDAGYLDHNKFLLASAKEAGQKVYLDRGIYADISGRFKAGKYRPFEWSFPDFKDGRYDAELLAIRNLYRQQLKEYRAKQQIQSSGRQ
jgi:hypothetical protein